MYPPFLCPKCATLHNIVRKALTGRKLHETKLQCCLEFAARRRDLLYRLYYQGVSERVLAKQLGISQAAVHKRKEKILKQLRIWMKL